MFRFPLGRTEYDLGLAVVDKSLKQLVIAKKESSLHEQKFVEALFRNDHQSLLEGWSVGGNKLAPVDPLEGVQIYIDSCPSIDQGVMILVILYCIVHECFVPKFILPDVSRFKATFAYWLAKGNLPM